MLFSGHFVIADNFSWNQSNQGRTFIEKRYIVEIFWHRVENSSQIYLFIADTPYFLWEIKNKLLFDFQMLLFDTHFSTFTFSELSNFSKAFLS